MSAWFLTALTAVGVLAAIAGAVTATIGSRRARVGKQAALEASTIEYQLAHPPRAVIIRVTMAHLLARSGQRLAAVGLGMSIGGFALTLVPLILRWTGLDVT